MTNPRIAAEIPASGTYLRTKSVPPWQLGPVRMLCEVGCDGDHILQVMTWYEDSRIDTTHINRRTGESTRREYDAAGKLLKILRRDVWSYGWRQIGGIPKQWLKK